MSKKKVTVEKFDGSKQESVIDFGSVKVPTSWDEVTLQTMCDYMRRSKEKEDLLESDRREVRKWNKEHPEEKKDMPDENDSKYTLTDKDLLEVFTDFDISKYDILPVELYNSIMGNFSFVLKQGIGVERSEIHHQRYGRPVRKGVRGRRERDEGRPI